MKRFNVYLLSILFTMSAALSVPAATVFYVSNDGSDGSEIDGVLVAGAEGTWTCTAAEIAVAVPPAPPLPPYAEPARASPAVTTCLCEMFPDVAEPDEPPTGANELPLLLLRAFDGVEIDAVVVEAFVAVGVILPIELSPPLL